MRREATDLDNQHVRALHHYADGRRELFRRALAVSARGGGGERRSALRAGARARGRAGGTFPSIPPVTSLTSAAIPVLNPAPPPATAAGCASAPSAPTCRLGT